MAVNKNFVVKHGLEVNDNLILANASTKRVGIGSTVPDYTLDVAGGIGATHIYAAGISTFADDVEILSDLRVGTGGTVFSILSVGSSIGIGTNLPEYLVDIRSPVSTGQTALYVYGDVRISGDINADDIFFDDVVAQDLYVSGIGTVITLEATDGTITYLDSTSIVTTNLSGTISTITNLSGTIATITNFVGTYSTITSLDVTDGTITNLVGTYSTISSLDVTNLNALANLTAVAATITSLSGTIATITEFNATDVDITNLNVSGISTLGTVQVSSGIVTATSGIVTYYGDGSQLDGVIGGIGINTEGGLVGFGITYLHLFGAGVSTTFYDQSVGIATIFLEGGGGGGSVSISSVAPLSPSNGDLWYNIDYGRTFVYYDEVALGIGATAVWVDAAPFNQGIDAVLAGVAFSTGSATSPSLYFSGDVQTGFFSPTPGEFTIVSAGSSILNVNSGGINVTGIVTAVDFDSLSDINYKENIETIDDALDKVSNIRGVKFDWKESGQKSYGVIAQELENILPELVHGENPRVVNYNGIIGVLIEAIKELKDEVYQLKSKINK